jgi:uncharacterized protein involved in response to NO
MIESPRAGDGTFEGATRTRCSAPPRPPLRPDMTVRQVAADYPASREVFRRHGEPERPSARFGHLEPLDRFAQRHGVPLDALLAELSQAAGVEVSRDDDFAGRAHRPFVGAALAVTLSLGAGWGTLLLVEVGRRGSLAAIPAAQVVAHGEAQFWGFVAPFIIGVAASFLPRTTARPRPHHAPLDLLLGALVAGVLGGFIWSLAPRRWLWLGFASGAALILAALGFLALAVQQLAGKLRAPWARFVLAAAAWMIVWAVVDLMLRGRAGTAGPGNYTESARGLLMELALFGFALNAAYGFGQRLLPGMLGGGSPRRGAVEATFALHNAGVLTLVVSHVRWPGLCGALGAAAIVAGAGAWAIGLQGFRRKRRSAPRPEAGPVFLARYIQLALFWLLAGLVLLVAGEFTAAVRGVALPRAYLGATRHALTVGFLTTLILGVGQRLLPILSHDLLAWPRLVVPIFVLIAAGNALRVAAELATLVWPIAFRVLPASAVLELTALALFAANVFRTLWPRPDPLLRTGRVTLTTRVAVLLAEHPWLEDHLVAWGLSYIGRVRSVPAELTLGSLAAGEGLVTEAIVAQINALLAARATSAGGSIGADATAPGRSSS